MTLENVFKKLQNAWVGLLVIFCRDENACSRNERQDEELSFSPQKLHFAKVLHNIFSLHKSVIGTHSVVECLRVVVQFLAQVIHLVDIHFAVLHIERLRVVQLAQGLSLHKSVKDHVHGNFSFERLGLGSQTFNAPINSCLRFVCSVPQSHKEASLVVETTTGSTVANVCVALVGQEQILAALGTLRTGEVLHGDALSEYRHFCLLLRYRSFLGGLLRTHG